MRKAIEDILSQLKRVRSRSGGRYQASCPVPTHGKGRGDINPSLGIRELPDGTILLKCGAGCETIKILDVLGLTYRDLYPKGKRWSKTI
jgi:hypothetical protein